MDKSKKINAWISIDKPIIYLEKSNKMNTQKTLTKTFLLVLLFMVALCQTQITAQLSTTPKIEQSSKAYKHRSKQGGLDFSVFHLNFHQAFAVSDRLMLGFEGGLGFNVLSLFLVAGDHFATDATLFAYDGFDEFGNEFYAEGTTLQLFARIRTKERKDLLDVGFQTALFLHSDDSDDDIGGGTFRGIYIKSFLAPKSKTTGTQRIGIGAQVSAGQYDESDSINQFGVRCSFWIRFYFQRKVGQRNF